MLQIPTVGGEVFFDDCYSTNPLVNAFSAGILKVGTQASATSYGVGNGVFIVGSATGKDGIGGASFASEDITAKSSEKLPAVQEVIHSKKSYCWKLLWRLLKQVV